MYEHGLVHETSWQWHLFGLNVSTGAITFKQRIVGHPTNDPHLSFSALPQDQRTGLLLMNGWVYAAFASHCDNTPYAGYVAGVERRHATPPPCGPTRPGSATTRPVSGRAGGGLMSDGAGRIFFTSGNGISPAKGPGSKPPGQLAESMVRLQPQSDGSLKAQDFFSPANAPKLDAGDYDFGAGGPVGLPFGTTTYPDVVAQAGKYGRLYLLNRDNLGGRQQSSAGGDEDLFEIGHLAGPVGPPRGLRRHDDADRRQRRQLQRLPLLRRPERLPARVQGRGQQQRRANPDRPGQQHLPLRVRLRLPGGDLERHRPELRDHLGGRQPRHQRGRQNSWLGAFDATPQPKAGGGTKMREIWSGAIGTVRKFTMAATGNGMVYVGTRDGNVYGFGITSGAALKSGGTATFADTPVHSATTSAATVTATRTVTVTGASLSAVTTPDPFTISRVTVTRPAAARRR